MGVKASMIESIVKSGYPCFEKDAFVFEFRSEAEARGAFACDSRFMLTVLERWNASNALVRIPGQTDLCVPIATIRLMQEFEPLVQVFLPILACLRLCLRL
jgi:hypothetical protein